MPNSHELVSLFALVVFCVIGGYATALAQRAMEIQKEMLAELQKLTRMTAQVAEPQESMLPPGAYTVTDEGLIHRLEGVRK